LSETHAATGLPLAEARRNPATSLAELETNASANQTRFNVNSRTTYNVSCPFSGCSPSMLNRNAFTAAYSSANTRGSCWRAASIR
jgi:hypothetical protein